MRGNRFFPMNNQGPARAGLFCREEAAPAIFIFRNDQWQDAIFGSICIFERY
jgi:hypothetical protein